MERSYSFTCDKTSFNTWWVTRGKMGILKGFSRFVLISRIDSLENLSPLCTTVSRNVISLSEISAVNLIVGWKLLACSINNSISCSWCPIERICHQ